MLPILITSAAIPNDPGSVNLKSFELRKKYTIDSILYWRKLAPQNPLIICDGSNFSFSEILSEINLDTSLIECLNFQNNNNKIIQLGKGYGESEIIKYALFHSSTLKNFQFFAKCTAKLWVPNFLDITKNFNNHLCMLNPFISSRPFTLSDVKFIDTRFYVFNKLFYINNFLTLYDEYEPFLSIEDLFKIKIGKLGLEKVFFSRPPIISGVSGGSGKYYNTKVYRILKDKIRYHFWKNKPDLRKFFI